MNFHHLLHKNVFARNGKEASTLLKIIPFTPGWSREVQYQKKLQINDVE